MITVEKNVMSFWRYLSTALALPLLPKKFPVIGQFRVSKLIRQLLWFSILVLLWFEIG